MKIAVISDEVAKNLFDSESLLNLLSLFRHHGFGGVEVRSFRNYGPHLLNDRHIEDIASVAKEYRFEIPAIASPVFKCPFPQDQSAMNEQLEILARCIQVAQKLGAKIVRVFAFSQGSVNPLVSADMAGIVEAFQKPAAMAAEAGITLGIENEHTTSINCVDRLVELLSQIDHPNVQAVYDPANDVWSGHPATPRRMHEVALLRYALNKLFPFITHIHVKDALPPSPGFPSYSPPIGLGIVPWPAIIQYMIENKYHGWWSIETHYRLEALTKEQVDRPGGAEYSQGGYEATLVCLHNFLEIARQAGAR